MSAAVDLDRPLYCFRSPNLLFRGATLIYEPQNLSRLWFSQLPRLVPPGGLVVQQPVADRRAASFGTVAEVRYTDRFQTDGIELRGVDRVRITGGSQQGELPQVTTSAVRERRGRDAASLSENVKRAALDAFADRRGLEWAWTATVGADDPEVIADIVCHALFADRPERAELLGTGEVDERLRQCLTVLGRMGHAAGADRPAAAPRRADPPPPPPLRPDERTSSQHRPPSPPTPRPPAPSPPGQPAPSFAVRPPRRETRDEPVVTAVPSRPSQPEPPERGQSRTDVVVRHPSELRTFADVGGMDKLKRELRRSVGVLVRQPEAVAALDYRFSGVLLHGPPGVGKSYLAEAVAGEFGMHLIKVSIGDVLSCWHGESERALRATFAAARRSAPSLLFFDEFDAVAARRGGGAGSPNDTFDRRILDQLLSLLDDVQSSPGVVVMAATNDLRALDPAAIREGRFDRQVFVDLPDRAARRAILATHLRTRRTEGHVDLDDLADRSAGLSAAAIRAIVVAAAGLAIESYEAGDTAVPAITSGLLDRAVSERRGRDRPLLEPRSWDDLVLPPETVGELRRLVRMIVSVDDMRRRGLRPVTGALLTGPPGTGKTTVARVIASQTEGAVNFYPVRASDILSSALGSSAARMRDLFERARQYAPSIIFIDEVDSLLCRRGPGEDSAAQERDTVVAEFLSQLDGLACRPGVFVLAATNLPDRIDPAATRSGRLTRRIDIPLPDRQQRLALLRLFLRGVRVAEDVDLEEVAAACHGRSGADIESICAESGFQSLEREHDDTVHRADFAAALERHGIDGFGPALRAVPSVRDARTG